MFRLRYMGISRIFCTYGLIKVTLDTPLKEPIIFLRVSRKMRLMKDRYINLLADTEFNVIMAGIFEEAQQ